MKQKIAKIISILVIIFILIVQCNMVLGAEYTDDYTIQSYNIDMIVNEDNTFDITETITAYFNVEKHGIYRKIPLRNYIERNDGTKSHNIAKITDINVDTDFTTTNENGYKVIKIGNANSTSTGIKTYKINYKYNIGKDPLKDEDEFYYNLIGDQWDTDIKYVTFSIKMPKNFDKSLLGFSSGKKGTVDSNNINYSVTNNTITGYVNKTLHSGEALTVRLKLPEGYFIGADSNFDIYSVVTLVLCAVFVLITDLLWRKYGKDDTVVETVEFYPPEDMNSAEVGYIYNGNSDNQSVISLLIYLANKGYIEIGETEEQGLLRKEKTFKITKIKEYDGNNKYEKIFFDGLFKQKTSVTKIDLYDSFYMTLNKIKSEMNKKENKATFFDKQASSKIKWVVLMALTIFVLITVKPVIEYFEPMMLIFALLFPGIGFSVLISSLIGINKIPKIFGILWGAIFGGVPFAIAVVPAICQDPMYLLTYGIGIISIIIITIFIKIMPKRTEYGNELYGKIKGFKRFLQTAEKPQLETLVDKNPQYFYNILPYTYALGVSKKWMQQFESIALQAPNWYSGYDTFSNDNFNNFMTDTMNSAQSAMVSSPSSSGDSSGGGSSGGGSGGGGGGSW